ncbi:MAG: transporter, ATPase subunit [Acidobacteriaceae bacterium]|nr:transporter, ATPase subunit [Acidobacteriaceae bacterium]
MQLSSPSASATAEAPGNDLSITFEDVQLAFEQNKVLRGVSFQLRRGETKVLLGIAGAGKSTILKLALGLVKPDSGRISVLGEEVSSMEEEDLFALRRRVGMVFQESALFDSLTVEENVSYRLREEHAPEDEIKRRVVEALRFVELEHTLEKFPSELSGGMRRRVAIARAIVNEPEVILYDSPTGGLDPITSTRIIELVVKQRDFYKTSALLVTHRLQDAFTLASSYFDPKANEMRPVTKDNPKNTNTSFMIMRDGKVIFDGNATELACTNDEYIREFIS